MNARYTEGHAGMGVWKPCMRHEPLEEPRRNHITLLHWSSSGDPAGPASSWQAPLANSDCIVLGQRPAGGVRGPPEGYLPLQG